MDAIARFEIPETCCYCPCCSTHMYCQLACMDAQGNEDRPKWCPLQVDNLNFERMENHMGIDLSRFKVIHGDKVLNAIALLDVRLPGDMDWEKRDIIVKPKTIEVLALNEDGNIVSIKDEAWTFQFLPIM